MSRLSFVDVLEELLPSNLELESLPTRRDVQEIESHFNALIDKAVAIEEKIKKTRPKSSIDKQLSAYYNNVVCVAEKMSQHSAMLALGGSVRLAAYISNKGGYELRCKNIFDEFEERSITTLSALDAVCTEAKKRLGPNATDENLSRDAAFISSHDKFLKFLYSYAQQVASAAALVPEDMNALKAESGARHRLHDWAVRTMEECAEHSLDEYRKIFFHLMFMAQNSHIYFGAEFVVREAYDERVLIMASDTEAMLSEGLTVETAAELSEFLQIQLSIDVSMVSAFPDKENMVARAGAAFHHHMDMLRMVDSRGADNFLQEVMQDCVASAKAGTDYNLGEARLIALIERRLNDNMTGQAFGRPDATLYPVGLALPSLRNMH